MRRRPTAPARLQSAGASLRALLRGVPRAAWICALAACLNAAAWSFVTPDFQLPDEASHYAYTEYLVQHDRPPRPQPQDALSTNEQAALVGLRVESVQFAPENGTIWTTAEQHQLEQVLRRNANRHDGNGAGAEVGGEPWLYYALEAIPYKIAEGGTPLDRLALMRLLSALLGGITVLFVFLFLREALPGTPWAWTVGALGAAFQPLFGFMSGGVNSDALLYTTAAALFFLLARGFRRGLTPALAAAIGATLAAGTLTKFNFLGLLPGAVAALAAIAMRRRRRLSLATLRLPALALGVAAVPLLLTMAMNGLVWERPTLGLTTTNFGISGTHPTLGGALAYAVQFYVAHVPGTERVFHQLFPLRDLWINGFIGRYGIVETQFSPRVYGLALIPLALLAVLCVRTLVRDRDALWARRRELAAYAALTAVFLVFVATASYSAHLTGLAGSGAQARYLLPLLPLYATALALAARGVGSRWAPAAGAAIVVLAIAHDVFSQLLVASRFYA